MADKRTMILERLLAILEAVPLQLGYDQHSVFRDRGLLQKDQLPAFVLLDGVEEAANADFQMLRRGRQFMAPQLMQLRPQIFVLLEERKLPGNEGVAEELTTFRNAIISAVANDALLMQICGPNGGVALLRVETDMQTGAAVVGQLRFDFAFNYVLDPYRLPDGSTT
jgi:hypothetical protein